MVVAIAGIVVALAAVNLFPSDAEIGRRESARVALALERARDAAWFGGRPVAVSFAPGALHGWRAVDGRWRPDPARDERLGSGLRVTALAVDGQPLDPAERLVFLPDGFGTPFRLALQVRGIAWAVEGDAAGGVALEGP